MLTAHPPRTSLTTPKAAVARGCDYDYRYCQPANCTWTVDGGLYIPDRGRLGVGMLDGFPSGPTRSVEGGRA